MRDWFRLLTAVVVTAALLVAVGSGGSWWGEADESRLADHLPAPDPDCDTDASLRYVGAGDGVPFGAKDIDTESEVQTDSDRFTEVLTKQLQESDSPGPWCLFNTAHLTTNTDDYENGGDPNQQSLADRLRPRLITLTVGRENDSIKNHVTTCFDQVKDHHFLQANVCALAVLGNQPAFKELNDDLFSILNKYKVQMSGSPNLVVAVTGYYNPYPSATDVMTEIPGFCAKLVDTIPTCTIRWILLPPVLVILDQIVKELNSTIEGVVDKFAIASQGRFYFVNPYDEFEDHCMKMNVDVKTKVYHPTNQVDNHDSENDFGCSTPWIESDGDDGTFTPFPYLTPAVTGVLLLATQTTSGMGIYPNKEGHECLADLIYEAENGWGPLKNRLGIAEAHEDPC